MAKKRAFISGVGLITALGKGCPAHVEALRAGLSGIRPLCLFPPSSKGPFPVGEISGFPTGGPVPRTHALALAAAIEAMANESEPPDAIVLGGTTGGMPATEVLIRDEHKDRHAYRWHGTGTVATYLAAELGCTGPAWTVSTACSSGTLALITALELIRTGRARRVLAGGADALCRLTYHGFHMLQLIDPAGARPLDRDRAGITVGEAAAMLMVKAGDEPGPDALAELLGGGLSCDAYHPSSPHQEGTGALSAMQAALRDAGVEPGDIDYVNLHGTGSVANDSSEARAVTALFGDHHPPLSSSKGAVGHTLAAAGAVDAAFAVLAIQNGLLPANTGCVNPDPSLGLRPVLRPGQADLGTILSNSFGFGGNNAALVIGKTGRASRRLDRPATGRLAVLGSACLTGAGHTKDSLSRFTSGESTQGALDGEEVTRDLPAKDLYRLRRLPRMTLALAEAALADAGGKKPGGVFLGTGWGPMTETLGFLFRLYRTGEETSSPRDFVASVHNAMAGHTAIRHKSTGTNVTTTGGDTSFEQAVFLAGLLARQEHAPFLLMGVDEAHPEMTPLLDPNAAAEEVLSDGGGALLVAPAGDGAGITLDPEFYKSAGNDDSALDDLIETIGGPERIQKEFGAIFAGIPASMRDQGQNQLDAFIAKTGYEGPMIDYRKLTGEYATCSAVAATIAVRTLSTGSLPGTLTGGEKIDLEGKGMILLGLGQTLTAIEIS
jgi:3-oxoacyl-(acyl-carrier-protein) synthase